MAGERSWSERTAHNREVPGSSPGPATISQIKQQRASSALLQPRRLELAAQIGNEG